MRKKLLEKRLAKLNAKLAEIRSKVQTSTDAAEVRELTERAAEITDDIDDITAELAIIEDEEKRAAAQTANEQRGTVPAGAQLVNPISMGGASFGTPEKREDEDIYAGMEYRRAFKEYVQRGTAIPEKFEQRQAAANTNSLGAIIPTTILNELTNEIRKVYGNLYSKVRKLNIPGGVKIPVGKLQATFKWITEKTVSPRQNAGTTETVEFSYNVGEIRIAETLLASIVTLDAFEREVVKVMLEAFLQAMDIGIVRGTGNGQMLGILNDSRVPAGNVVTFTAAEINDWTKWRKKFFAKLPLGYRSGDFIFPLSTVESYLETMADNNNNPIFRQATGLEMGDGDAAAPNGRFFGRTIDVVEPDVVEDFDAANAGDVVGVFWQPEAYAINSNMQFGMKRYFDEEANEWVNKMLVIVDGKLVNPAGVWLIKKSTT
ncbi:phage major capsid protein [Candidatus Saccharibacteria bacterium]|nr:phage major capsid protein [Candidatus Saccharibacteria bacterium]